MTKLISKQIPAASQHNFPLKKTMLAMCVGAAMQSTASAQEAVSAEEEVLEEVTVYGTRLSLKSAQDIKKNADTHVDAISAADITALPDVSVLEAIQRIPGVSIERFAAPNDPDHFSTEGSGVTLRGLPNTRSELNGRDTFSADSGRGLSFEDISPELISSVQIFKNQTADMIEGGISGTIDIQTRKPFDSDERQFSFAANANYGDLEEEVTPSVSGVFSDRWDLEGGEIGLLLSYANSDLDFRSDGAQAGFHFFDQDTGRYTPNNAGIRSTSTNRTREAISAVLQFENSDQTFSAIAEYIRSEATNNWLEHAFFSDDAGGSPSADSIYDSQGRFVSGRIQGLAGGLGPQTRRSDGETLTQDFSLKLGFQPTDRLNITADFQYVDSSNDVIDLSVFGGIVGGGHSVDLALGGDTPSISFNAPDGAGADFFTNPENYFWRAAMDHIEESEGDELAARLDFEYELESGFFTSVEGGVRWAERDQTTRWSTYNWGNLSETWTGNGLANFAGSVTNSGFSNAQAGAFSFGDFFAGGVAGLPGSVGLFGDAALVSDFQLFQDSFDGDSTFRNGLFGRDGDLSSPYIPAEVNRTVETNNSAYVRLNFELDGDNRIAGNVGLRYVDLETQVDGGIVFPLIQVNNPNNNFTADQLAFANGFSSNEAARSSFDTILPSLNVKYEISDETILRFGASKAIAFPDLGNLRYNYNMTSDIDTVDGLATLRSFRQTSGNPFLKPLESIGVDLSLEHYFADSSFVSAGVFYKDLKNFFSTTTTPQNVTNPSTGVTQVVEIAQPFNVGEANLSGFEFAYQQFFDNLPGVWSGLGLQFNYTYLNPSDVPQQNLRPEQFGSDGDDLNRASVPYDNLPLQGLSENQFNIVGLFQNDTWDARLAYNWRDDYLLTIREVNSSNVGFDITTFADARGQLDGSIFYKVNDNWQVGVQGTNLTQPEVTTSSQVDATGTRVFRHSFIYDRRFTFVVRGNF